VAHITKPVARLVIALVLSWPFGSFRYGVAYPIASHLFFGMIGGLLAALIVFGVNALPSKSNSTDGED